MKIFPDKIQLAPTDLSNHLGCPHLTELERRRALGQNKGPSWMDPAVVVLAQRGAEHESAYVEHLKRQNLTVEYLKGQPVDATVAAMQRGVDVIVQAPLTWDWSREGSLRWHGYADILLKVATPSKLGEWSYEVQDTKLSRNTRAATILQLSLYTELVGAIQEREPEFMHVVKPAAPDQESNFEVESFRFDDFKAYYRLSKSALEEVVSGQPRETYPNPVEHCGVCSWWKDCDKRRREDDHPSLIAGIRSMHLGELQDQEIHTLEQFARRESPLAAKPKRGTPETFVKVHHQAKIQFKGRIENRLVHELLPLESGRGFYRLPEPDRGDIYFDIEGDPFYDQLGLEYLLGYAYLNDAGELVYEKVWAKNHVEEKHAFDKFMTFVTERLKRYPSLHIYHFAPYEPSAVKRLSLRHTIHEESLDRLLRSEKFIDLHAVAREGVRASVERYSLKDLENFTSFQRSVDLPVASSARRTTEFALELKDLAALTPEVISIVEGYNADDCFATRALHTWLEDLRTGLVSSGSDIPRPEAKPDDPSENVEELLARSQAIFRDLTQDLPADRKEWTDEHSAKWLLANQIDYFRRESKSAWWEYFRLHDMDYEDLLDERKGIAGLEHIGEVPTRRKGDLPIHLYKYPPQEVGLSEDDCVHEVKGIKVGTIHSISYESCTVAIKKTAKSKELHPRCIHEEEVVTIEPLATAICDIANSVIEDGMDSLPYRAAKDLLMKRPPRLKEETNGPLLKPGEDIVEGSTRVASLLKNSILGIQGPPGTGKTYIGAMMILALASQGKRIGVTAPSHKVILNLFTRLMELSAERNIPVSIIHRSKDDEGFPDGVERAKDNKQALNALGSGKVAGGTAWLWASNDARETLDYLFVDEAGQMSLAHVLAASRSARNVVLLGDPQQLEQPQKASHPEGADIAALSHLLDGRSTIPDDKGVFLAVTRRLHPNVTAFTSELFYEGRLASLGGLDRQVITGSTPFAGAGLFFVPVEHEGNQNRSLEEVEVIADIVSSLLSSDVRRSNAQGESRKLEASDILIVAPYNAQVAAITERLPELRVGTVDKFQGQEASVVIYSMTSSSHNDAPRGMSFLYNPNRLNVATSRAQCVAILVASPRLLQAECRTIEQMRWANALCRYKEMSTERIHERD